MFGFDRIGVAWHHFMGYDSSGLYLKFHGGSKTILISFLSSVSLDLFMSDKLSSSTRCAFPANGLKLAKRRSP